jgi:NitT/TauT family transport system ATP-binding protein
MASSPEPGLTPLPHAPIAMVLGLLELLREKPGGREDLYKLGQPLGYELDDLLPVTEAAKHLGLAVVAGGDIELTETGRALARDDEPERKERLGRLLRRLQLVDEICVAVERGEGRLGRAEVLERLQEHFSPAESERQLQTALDWGRYGELFDYDGDAEEFVRPAAG